jgi:hypothetical protein
VHEAIVEHVQIALDQFLVVIVHRERAAWLGLQWQVHAVVELEVLPWSICGSMVDLGSSLVMKMRPIWVTPSSPRTISTTSSMAGAKRS